MTVVMHWHFATYEIIKRSVKQFTERVKISSNNKTKDHLTYATQNCRLNQTEEEKLENRHLAIKRTNRSHISLNNDSV